MTSRRELYAMGEPFGSSCTRREAGRVVYGGGGGGGDSSSTSRPFIPDELKPLANRYTDLAIQYSNTPWQGYAGQRYADLNSTQQQGLGMIQNRAVNGSQTMSNAEGALNNMLTGNQANPYLDSLVNKAQQSVAENFSTMTKPQLESAGVRSGSFGNANLDQRMGLQQKAAAQQMSDIATQMYGNAYNTDQANKLQAMNLAPTYGNAAYNDAAQLLNAGGISQAQTQKGLDFGYNQFVDQQNYPVKQLQAMSGVLGQTMGNTTTSSGGGGK
jgi:hypothetical protein